MSPIYRIQLAQNFFRFAYLIGSPISFGLKVDFPEPPEVHVWGRHSLSPDDLHLRPETFELCGTILERLAYRLLAMELDSALAVALRGVDRFNHEDDLVRNASIVVRLVRNAVAHNVLDPVWKIDRKFRNRQFKLDGILTFDTSGLHGQTPKRLDFGGPIALFRLSEQISAFLTALDRNDHRSGQPSPEK